MSNTIDVVRERERALKRRAQRERPNQLRTKARTILFLAWDRSEENIRAEIAERYPKLEPAEVEELTKVTLDVQRTERARLEPRPDIRYQPDPDAIGMMKRPKRKTTAKKMTQAKPTKTEPKPLDLRAATPEQRQSIYDVVDTVAATENPRPGDVRKAVRDELNIALDAGQASHLLQQARKRLGLPKLPDRRRERKKPKPPHVTKLENAIADTIRVLERLSAALKDFEK